MDSSDLAWKRRFGPTQGQVLKPTLLEAVIPIEREGIAMDKHFCISMLLSARNEHWRPQIEDSPLPSRCDYIGWEKYVLLCSRAFHPVRLLFHVKRQKLHHVLSVADAASPLSSHCTVAWIREAWKTDDRDDECAGRLPVERSNQELDGFPRSSSHLASLGS